MALLPALVCICCTPEDKESAYDVPDIPSDIDVPEVDRTSNTKACWALAMININNLNTREKVETELSRAAKYGLNEIWVDVKPSVGYALYDSDILPHLTSWDGATVPDGYDYLGTIIDVAKEKGISIIAAINTLGYGDAKNKTGLIYDSHDWDSLTQGVMKNGKVTDMRDLADAQEDGALLEPSSQKVQEFVISIVKEICTKYPDIKGVCLDYCRYYGGEYGLSSEAMDNFRSYCGNSSIKVSDILGADGTTKGSYYAQWIEFRSMTIKRLISKIRTTIKDVDSDKKLCLWASADYNSRYLYGQNWASTEYKVDESSTFTANYNQTAFAELLDVFALGAYSDRLKASESYYSVEGYIARHQDFIKGATKVVGSIACYNCKNRTDMSSAVQMCMTGTEGIMVFDLKYLNSLNHWYGLYDGFKASNAL